MTVSSNYKQVIKKLNRIQKRQVPYATSQGLNDTAFDARKALRVQVVKKLHNPTKFTVNAFLVERANRLKLKSVVFVEDKRVSYLQWAILGGIRITPGIGTGVPVNQKLNKYGNIPGRAKGLVKKKSQFIATIKGITGVWERMGGKQARRVKLVTAFEQQTEYKPRFPFYKIINGVARSQFLRHFKRRFAHAVRTAR